METAPGDGADPAEGAGMLVELVGGAGGGAGAGSN